MTDLNRPASGSYGEKKDLQDLRKQLPPVGGPPPSAPPGAAPTNAGPPTGVTQVAGPAGGAPRRPDGMPPGIPSALVAPNQQDLPIGGPPVTDPAAGMQEMPPDQKTIAMLDMLSTSPQVSNETREWATTVLDILFA